MYHIDFIYNNLSTSLFKTDFTMTKRNFATDIDIDNILSKKYCKNTDNVDNVNERSLRLYLKSCNAEKSLESLSKTELDDIMKTYFVSLRKADGSKYQKQSLDGIRYSINRVLAKIHGAEAYDLVKDTAFARSREIYFAYCKTLKAEGKNVTRHYDRIPPETIMNIVSTLDPGSPVQLQWLSWIYIMMYFCRRGCENLHLMTKDTFKIEKNVNNRRYIMQAIDEETKNHKQDSECAVGGHMYEQPNNSQCPVKIYEQYLG